MTYCDFDRPGFQETVDCLASDLKTGRLEDASDILCRELQQNPNKISELVCQVKSIQDRQHLNGDHRVAVDRVIVRPDAATNGESSEVLIRDKRTGYTERIGGITFGVDDVENPPIVPGEPNQFPTQPAECPPVQQNFYSADSMSPPSYLSSPPSDSQYFGQQMVSSLPPMNYECAPPMDYDCTPPLYSNSYYNNQLYPGSRQSVMPYPVYSRPWHHRYAAYEPCPNSAIYQPAAYANVPPYGDYLECGSYPSFGLSVNLGSLLFGGRGRHW